MCMNISKGWNQGMGFVNLSVSLAVARKEWSGTIEQYAGETISRFRLAFLSGFHGATADTVSWLALFSAGGDSI